MSRQRQHAKGLSTELRAVSDEAYQLQFGYTMPARVQFAQMLELGDHWETVAIAYERYAAYARANASMVWDSVGTTSRAFIPRFVAAAEADPRIAMAYPSGVKFVQARREIAERISVARRQNKQRKVDLEEQTKAAVARATGKPIADAGASKSDESPSGSPRSDGTRTAKRRRRSR